MPASEQPDTRDPSYADRLVTLGGARWKRVLDVQRPYRWNLRRLQLGRTLDVGCGIGRNLLNLGPDSVGVDHNEASVAIARGRGLRACTSEEFFGEGAGSAREGSFDSALVAHVVEHMDEASASEVIASYLPFIRPGGKVLFICPQERGYASDSTHVRFVDIAGLRVLASSLGLKVERCYSFPLPRAFGRLFTYNEFCVLARTASFVPPGPTH
jgi:SAM-dependent methyltransferase